MAEILNIKTPAELGDDILVHQPLEGGVLRLVLNNPPANTLSEAMLAALQKSLDAAETDDSVRVIILAANGHLFCAGHDLKELTPHRADEDRGRAYFKALMDQCATVMQSIVNHPKPIIAEVNGLARCRKPLLIVRGRPGGPDPGNDAYKILAAGRPHLSGFRRRAHDPIKSRILSQLSQPQNLLRRRDALADGGKVALIHAGEDGHCRNDRSAHAVKVSPLIGGLGCGPHHIETAGRMNVQD